MPQITIEFIITIAVVLVQIWFFYSTFQRIKALENIFPEQNLDANSIELLETDKGIVEQIKIDSEYFSENFSQVIKSINKYLIKNKGTIDFPIIKSIVERNIESKDNLVSSNISLPLYVGLMGTFVGIVLGLFNIAFSGVNTQNINSFIGGVVIAMVASFFGLLFTVINNSYNLKNARAICDERKNNFFNFLQIELLPYLQSSLYDALDRLKININDFNSKFETNIKLFDSKFSDNITSFRDSIYTLSLNINAVVENTRTQKEFLIEIKKIGYNRLAEANMKVFTIIKDTLPTLIEFVQKQKELNQLVEQTTEFTATIQNIFNRIKTFEESINKLGENINSKEYLGNEVLKRIDENLRYLDKQYELLKQHEINSSQDIYDFFTKQYNKIKELSEKIKREVENSLDLNIENNPFQKLILLEAINKDLGSVKERMILGESFKKISDDLNTAKNDIGEIKQKLVVAIEESNAIDSMNDSQEIKKQYSTIPDSERSNYLENLEENISKPKQDFISETVDSVKSNSFSSKEDNSEQKQELVVEVDNTKQQNITQDDTPINETEEQEPKELNPKESFIKRFKNLFK